MLYYIKSHLEDGDIYCTSYDRESQRSQFWKKAIAAADADLYEAVDRVIIDEDGKMVKNEQSEMVVRTYTVNSGEIEDGEWYYERLDNFSIIAKIEGKWDYLPGVFFETFGEANKFVKNEMNRKYFEALAVVEYRHVPGKDYTPSNTTSIYDN